MGHFSHFCRLILVLFELHFLKLNFRHSELAWNNVNCVFSAVSDFFSSFLPSDVERRENPVCHFVTPLDGNMDSEVHRSSEVKIEKCFFYNPNVVYSNTDLSCHSVASLGTKIPPFLICMVNTFSIWFAVAHPVFPSTLLLCGFGHHPASCVSDAVYLSSGSSFIGCSRWGKMLEKKNWNCH